MPKLETFLCLTVNLLLKYFSIVHLLYLQNSVLLSIASFLLRILDTLIVYLVFDILDILTTVFILKFYLFTSFWLLLYSITVNNHFHSCWVYLNTFNISWITWQWLFLFWFLAFSRTIYNAWKVSVLGVILVRILPYLDWIQTDTPYFSLFSPNAGKCRQK